MPAHRLEHQCCSRSYYIAPLVVDGTFGFAFAGFAVMVGAEVVKPPLPPLMCESAGACNETLRPLLGLFPTARAEWGSAESAAQLEIILPVPVITDGSVNECTQGCQGTYLVGEAEVDRGIKPRQQRRVQVPTTVRRRNHLPPPPPLSPSRSRSVAQWLARWLVASIQGSGAGGGTSSRRVRSSRVPSPVKLQPGR